jgi:predicted TPR repeat methyltransferase
MPWVHKKLGGLAEDSGDMEKAREHYRRYLELSPDDEDAARIRRLIGG